MPLEIFKSEWTVAYEDGVYQGDNGTQKTRISRFDATIYIEAREGGVEDAIALARAQMFKFRRTLFNHPDGFGLVTIDLKQTHLISITQADHIEAGANLLFLDYVEEVVDDQEGGKS